MFQVCVWHVQVGSVVEQTQPSPSHHTVLFVRQIRHHAVLVNQDTTRQMGYVLRMKEEEEGMVEWVLLWEL